MTVEQLRVEARKLGYYVYPIKPREKLIPCTCGCNRRAWWYGAHTCKLVCKRCGASGAAGYTEAEARHNWNEMIKEELKNHDERSAV